MENIELFLRMHRKSEDTLLDDLDQLKAFISIVKHNEMKVKLECFSFEEIDWFLAHIPENDRMYVVTTLKGV